MHRCVVTRVWKFSLPRDKAVALVDLDHIDAQAPIFQKEFPDPARAENTRWYPFLGTYRPGAVYSHEFLFRFRNERDAWILVKTEIFVDGEALPKVAAMWNPICGGMTEGGE
jgi:hypothetical protein